MAAIVSSGGKPDVAGTSIFGDRVIFPLAGFRKSDVLDYYTRVSRYLLLHLRDRPVTLKRYPDEAGGEFFYEKDAPAYTPAWVKKFGVWRRSGESQICYIVIRDLATLQWAVEVGTLEFHPFLARISNVEAPTNVVFDLDPGDAANILHCARVALLLRGILEDLHLQSFAKVSGSKGIQVYVPLNTPATYAMTQPFARIVAELLQQQHPALVVAQMERRERKGKVFVDWSQNADYKTTVSVYSLRAKRRHPYISMPVRWDELQAALAAENVDSLLFNPQAALQRLVRIGDLFAPVLTLAQELPDAFTRVLGPVGRPVSPAKPHPAKLVRMPRRSAQGSRRVFLLERQRGRGLRLSLQVGERPESWQLPEGLPEEPGASSPAIETVAVHISSGAQSQRRQQDTGTCELIEGSFRKGAMRLFFNGELLQGERLLIRQEDGNWRLVRPTGRGTAGKARILQMPSVGDAAPRRRRSTAPGNASRSRGVPASLKSLPAAPPAFVVPMECRLVSQLPEGKEWRYELKLDGYRALALIRDKEVHLLSRHNNDLASQFPRVYTALQQSRLPDGVLDGEIVALDAEGRPSFQQLQNSRSADASIVFYVFDVLNYAGRDTTGLPLRERKRLLERLSASLAEPVRVSTVLEARVADILQQVASFGLEGVVAKRADSIYQPGKRPGSWVKYRSNEKEDFFIGGYLPGKNYFDAILVGHYKGKQLMFVKKLRNGFVPHTRKEVFAAIAPLRVPRCPFVNLPEPNTRRGAVDSEQMKQCVWVKPQVKCEVEFTEWTAGGRLRHAAFRQLVR